MPRPRSPAMLAKHRGSLRPCLACSSTPGSGGASPQEALMEKVIAAGLVAMVLSIIVGPKFIDFLRRNELGQHIREEGPEGHRTKQGTPTMGGVLIVLAAALPFLALSEYTLSAWTVFAVTHRVRRHRLHRRLHQGHPPPLARPVRPLEAAAARRDHGLPRLGRARAGARHRRLHPARSATSTCCGAGTCSSSSSSRAPRTA